MKTADDHAALRRAEMKRKIKGINRTFEALRAYSNNPTIDGYDERRVPTHVVR